MCFDRCSVFDSVAAQSSALKKGNRPVFITVKALAEACEDWKVIKPNGYWPKDSEVVMVSREQIVHFAECEWYIEGVYDGRVDVETFYQTSYHPEHSYIDFLKPLVDTFLKYAKDHPEKQDFAASTALHEVEAILTKAQTGH